MKIAILTSGILPVPAVQGGAVENLIDFYLEYNDRHKLHDITVYSVYNEHVVSRPELRSDVNHYRFIKTRTLTAKIRRRLLHAVSRDEYYNYHIEYYLNRAIRDLRRRHYDIIIMENRPGYAMKVRANSNAKLILHLHNDLLNDTTRQCEDIRNTLSGVICVSDYIAKRVLTIGATAGNPVTVYNGIDLKTFSPVPDGKTKRSVLGLSDDDFVLIFSGRINRDKGIDQLIDAMIRLREHSRIKLIIIGSSFFGNVDNKDDDFITQLKKKAESIEDRIIFTGFIPYNQVPDYLHAADAAVIPSVWDDPFPTTVLEAQAAGLPIITTDRGGIPEEVGDGNAIITPTGDGFVAGLADAIYQIYGNVDLRKRMGEASLKRSSLFAKERFAEDFFNAITQSIESNEKTTKRIKTR